MGRAFFAGVILCAWPLPPGASRTALGASARSGGLWGAVAGTCPEGSTEAADDNGPVCACVGMNTACAGHGAQRCTSAYRQDVERESRKPSVLRAMPWPMNITSTMESVWLFPGKIQGFRPALCPGCRCHEPCKRTVFIVGCGHSGTTYATRVVGSHPGYFPILAETGWFTTYGGTRIAFDSYRKEAHNCGKAGKSTLVEKTPGHINKLDVILPHFPEAKVIYMIRDGRDVALSLAKRFGYRLDHKLSRCMAAYRWNQDNQAAEKYLDHPQVLSVRYEDLVKHPTITANRISQFLEGTDAPPDVLAQFTGRSALGWGRIEHVRVLNNSGAGVGLENRELRNWQMNQPMFDGSGKWKNLTDDTLKGLYKCRGFVENMVRFGYLSKRESAQWYDRNAPVLPFPPEARLIHSADHGSKDTGLTRPQTPPQPGEHDTRHSPRGKQSSW